MLASKRFQDSLWYELEAADLIPDTASYERCYAKVLTWGEIEGERIISLVGNALWKRTLDSLKSGYPEDDCKRVLGFGHGLTEFAVAPLRLPNKEREAVVSLGALANFIVTLYDHLIDFGANPQELLPRKTLRLVIQDARSVRLFMRRLLGTPPSRMLAQLVVEYFRRLNRLAKNDPHNHVLILIKRIILLMYDIEGETIKNTNGYLSNRALRRKAALPFVALGLPAWLAAPEICPKHYWRHLRWLYQLGEFFGWIDDANDIIKDCASNQPNQLINLQVGLGYCEAKDASSAHAIAQKGKRVINEWSRQIPNANKLPLFTEDVFFTCVRSWLGGPSQQT